MSQGEMQLCKGKILLNKHMTKMRNCLSKRKKLRIFKTPFSKYNCNIVTSVDGLVVCYATQKLFYKNKPLLINSAKG